MELTGLKEPFRHMTVVVLGLDALDAGLVEYFDCDPLRLETNGQIETFSFTRDYPLTPEVWPTMATGLHPKEHGVYSSGTSEWDNRAVNFLSSFTGRLPISVRSQLGDWAEQLTGAQHTVGTTDSPTFFDKPDRMVHNWPGVSNGEELVKVWKLPDPKERQTVGEFERDLRGIGVQHFAWAREMLRHKVSLAGVHDHTLDMGGHIFGRDEERLRNLYEWTGRRVAEVAEDLDDDDELLIVSDHGIVTDFYHDEGDRNQSPVSHSWRAYAASTADDIPESVFEVFEWVEGRTDAIDGAEERIDIPENQLRNLGYM